MRAPGSEARSNATDPLALRLRRLTITILRSTDKSTQPQRRSPWMYLMMLVTAPAVLLIEVWPIHPHTRSGWLTFLALSAPLCTVGALFQRSVCSNPVVAKMDERTGDRTVSALRMLYLFSAMTLMVMLVWLGNWAWHRWGDVAHQQW